MSIGVAIEPILKGILTAEAAKWLGEKLFDFVMERFGSMIDDKISEKSKKQELTHSAFERKLREDVHELSGRVANLEAVIRQGRRLSEEVIRECNTSLIGNVNGNVYITINIHTDSADWIRDIIERKSSELLEIGDPADYRPPAPRPEDFAPGEYSDKVKDRFRRYMQQATEGNDVFE